MYLRYLVMSRLFVFFLVVEYVLVFRDNYSYYCLFLPLLVIFLFVVSPSRFLFLSDVRLSFVSVSSLLVLFAFVFFNDSVIS